MDGPVRTPPRFVPTLTAVVDLQEEATVAGPVPVSPPALEAAVEPALNAAGTTSPEAAPSTQAPRVEVPVAWEGVSTAPSFNEPPSAGRVEPPLLTEAFAPEPAFVPPLGAAPDDARVEPAFEPAPQQAAPAESAPSPDPRPAAEPFRALPIDEADAFRLEEELLHRVLQRVDLSLEDRLTEVVSVAVQQQLDAMVPRLRQQVEDALRQLVVEAMAHELSETPVSEAGSRTKLGLN